MTPLLALPQMDVVHLLDAYAVDDTVAPYARRSHVSAVRSQKDVIERFLTTLPRQTRYGVVANGRLKTLLGRKPRK